MNGAGAGAVAVVTGGARGLGRAICVELARRGSFVIINYKSNEEAAQETLEQVEAAGGRGRTIRADISDAGAVQRMFQEISREHRRVEILVNNAGITRDDHLWAMHPKSWREVVQTNLTGAFHCSKAVIRGMCAAGHGVIINIGSGSGTSARPGQTNYGASKAGLIGFSKSLGRELASRGVRVLTVAPGFIDTDMSRAASPSVVEESLQAIPMGRWGQPEEVAEIVGFLASPEAAFITGQTVIIDGGRMASENDFGLQRA